MTKNKKDKIENINSTYKYNGVGELITDISNYQLNKEYVCNNCGKKYKTEKGYEKHIKKCFVDNVPKDDIKKEIIKEYTHKEKYSMMINENAAFILKLNGVIIFDSDINDVMLLSFEEDHFRINKEKFTYVGLNFKYKK